MAAISITAGNVQMADDARLRDVTAGATITAGLVVYQAADGDYEAAGNGSAAAAEAAGIALHGAADGQPLRIQTGGRIAIGGTVAVGKIYVLGTTGGIIPVDDIAGSEYVTVIGVGVTTSQIELLIHASGVAAAGAVA